MYGVRVEAHSAGDKRNSGLSFLARCGLAVFALAAPSVGQAASCPPAGFRWLEDCSDLSESDQEGLDRLRYIRLDDGGHRWLSFGGEYRLRVDAQADALYGIDGADAYIAVQQRLLAHADIHDRSGMRLFAQLSAGEEDGRIPRRTIAESGVDAAQLFVDLPFKLGPKAGLLRAGRQEIDLGGNFLFGVRNATLRRSFNGGLLRTAVAGGSLQAFYGQPTQIRPGAFDDRGNPGERIGFAVFDMPSSKLSWGAFYFRRIRGPQTYQNASGEDRRHTLGGRFRWRQDRWTVNGQVAIQRGSVGSESVHAWGGQFDVRRALTASGRTAIGGQVLSFSGDDRPGDGRYGSFDPHYPNLNISNVPLFLSNNLTAVSLLAETRVGPVTVGGLAMTAVNSSAGDALYSQGSTFRGARGTAQASLAQVTIQAPLGRRLVANATLAHVEARKAIRSLGGRDVDFFRSEIVARF